MACPDTLPKLGCCEDEIIAVTVRSLRTELQVSNNLATDAVKVATINSLLSGLIGCLSGESFTGIPDGRRKVFLYGDGLRFPGDAGADIVVCANVQSAIQGNGFPSSAWAVRYDAPSARWRIEVTMSFVTVSGFAAYCLVSTHEFGGAGLVTDSCQSFLPGSVVIPIPAGATLTLAETNGSASSTELFVPGQAGVPACCTFNPAP